MRSRRFVAAGVVAVGVALSCGGSTTTSDGGTDATACAKTCNGACASGTDPSTGCGGTSCTPCSGGAHATASCDTAGACSLACDPGYADCDPMMPGCESVTTDPKNCGACNHVCGSANTTAVACNAAGDGGAACAFTCSAGYAHCSADDSTGCETNLSTDANNCGACGHSCGGGGCSAGYCVPTLLAGDPTKETGLKSLYGLVLLGSNLYGTDWEGPSPGNGLVYTVPTSGTGKLSWIAGGGVSASANYIATDGTTLSYSIFHVGEAEGAGIWNVHTDGTSNTLTVSGGTTGGGPACTLSTAYGYEVNGLSFDSGYIYWIRDTYGGCFPSTASCQCQGIYRANADGTNVTQYYTSNWYTVPLADSGTLYMVDYFNKKVVFATSAMFTSNTPPAAFPSAGTPTTLQTDSTYVYWIDQTAKKFYRAKKVGATTSDDITPASGMPTGTLGASFLADASANRIFFVSPASTPNTAVTQQIYMMPKDGSGPAQAIPNAVISSYGDSLSAWTQDASAIYWTTYGYDTLTQPFAAVYKLAKP